MLGWAGPSPPHTSTLDLSRDEAWVESDVPPTLLVRWLSSRWPSPRAAVEADRAGITLVRAPDDSIAVLTDAGAHPVRDMLRMSIASVVNHAPRAAAGTPLEVIVPAALEPATERELVGLLRAVTKTDAAVVGAAAHALVMSGTAMAAHALVVTLGRWDAGITLVRVDPTPVAIDAARPHGVSFDAFDDLVVQRASRRLLGDFGIDLDDDPSLLQLARAQVRTTRLAAGHTAPWALSIAGGEVVLEASERASSERALETRLHIACEQLVVHHALSPAEVNVSILVAQEPLWPGLAERLVDALGLPTPMRVVAASSAPDAT